MLCCLYCRRDKKFLSTPSARRATEARRPRASEKGISIHALREEGDFKLPFSGNAVILISIHALREEGDAVLYPLSPPSVYFYPRPPRGGRLLSAHGHAQHLVISIHALREEGDAVFCFLCFLGSNFYPRPPRGGRRQRSCRSRDAPRISIHALREEGDQ